MLSELLPYSQFVVWKYTVEQGKLKKRPFDPRTHVPARTNDPTTWTSIEPALKALASGRYNGIGFVFSERDPFTGTDLDNCVGKDGSIAVWAQEIITSLSSCTEYSPSKLGVHILTQATLPGAGRKRGHVEMYAEGRFFTITTDHVPGAEVLEKAQSARNRERFQALWQGNVTGYRSKSEADFTLALLLLYWTNDDLAQTKRLFQQSGLYDPEKTDRMTGEHTYLDMTIYNALKKRRI